MLEVGSFKAANCWYKALVLSFNMLNDFADVGGWVLQSSQLLVQSTCFELQHASTLLFTAVHPR